MEETKVRRKGGKKKWLLLAVLAVVILAGVLFWRSRSARPHTMEVSYTEAAAEVRDITNSLTGSGTLQPADSYTVTTLVSGEILSDHFEEGDIVAEDQLLYVIDSSDASSSQTQAQNSYEQAVKSKYPTADMGGTVEEVYVNNGDSVNAGTQLLRIVGDNKITMDFAFSYVDSSQFYVGQKADIFITGLDGSITGYVTAVSSDMTTVNGRDCTTVRVQAENPGLVTSNYTASAVIGSNISYGEAGIRVSASSVITAGASGKVEGLNLLPGDSVTNGQRICTITGDSVDNQIENALTSLENARDKLEDYQVTSPISGTVIEKYAKAGDNAGTGGSSTLCIIYDLSYLEMTLNIDELDISDVAVGQSVNITADAVEGRSYTGVVTKVSVVGTTSGGTTTYPVTVRIDETDGLLPGMNVDAEIVLSGASGVLAIPNSAVNRGNTVLITADSPSAANALDQEAPDGYVYVQVETGESDDSYIEIISGLQEGDTVAYIRTSSGSDMGGMMMGGMPGGNMGGMSAMPSGGGGMPSGGGPGGGGGFSR